MDGWPLVWRGGLYWPSVSPDRPACIPSSSGESVSTSRLVNDPFSVDTVGVELSFEVPTLPLAEVPALDSAKSMRLSSLKNYMFSHVT